MEEVYQRFHNEFLDLFQKTGISYDLFTTTHTENHFKVSQSHLPGFAEERLSVHRDPPAVVFARRQALPARPLRGRHLLHLRLRRRALRPVRQAAATCSSRRSCSTRAPRWTARTPELRDTEHFFLDLSKLEPDVAEFLRERQHYWRETVVGQSLGQIESEGLQPRPITRDLDWGIPVPVEGWEGKCIYVWFEAVIGYLSATIEWAKISGQPEAWNDWWTNPAAKAFYFIGKDNIFFHAAHVACPAHGRRQRVRAKSSPRKKAQPLNLPYDVPANQFMNLEGQKISGSRNWAVWGLDFLTRYDPDALRYYLTVNMPEIRDTDWDWAEFVARNNNELVATWGNLANRVLSFAYKHWDGHVPDPGELRPADQEILATVESGFQSVGEHLERGAPARRAERSAAPGLRGQQVPGHRRPLVRDQDRQSRRRQDHLHRPALPSTRSRCCFAPFLPFSSERLHTFLGYTQPLFGEQYIEEQTDALGKHNVLRYRPPQPVGNGNPASCPPGRRCVQPAPLFKKLDESVVAEERARLGK